MAERKGVEEIKEVRIVEERLRFIKELLDTNREFEFFRLAEYAITSNLNAYLERLREDGYGFVTYLRSTGDGFLDRSGERKRKCYIRKG